ncbi:MAG: hypothetical protein H8E49_14540 [Gammaproteobacteria bacterium]|nr:hypothetical protein [Gammaproteobacteria bacterium]
MTALGERKTRKEDRAKKSPDAFGGGGVSGLIAPLPGATFWGFSVSLSFQYEKTMEGVWKQCLKKLEWGFAKAHKLLIFQLITRF